VQAFDADVSMKCARVTSGLATRQPAPTSLLQAGVLRTDRLYDLATFVFTSISAATRHGLLHGLSIYVASL
jgi:hypothetical protein